MKKKDNGKFKKQLVSGGIYIALAAAVVTVTLNGVNSIIGSNTGFEIPDPEVNVPDMRLEMPDIVLDEIVPDNDFSHILQETEDNPFENSKKEIAVSDAPKGVDAETKEEKKDGEDFSDAVKKENTAENLQDISESSPESKEDENVREKEIDASGEPDDVEYPTEPDPVSYGVYAKPADGYIDREYSPDELLYSPTMGDFRTHNGIDITGDLGSAVRSIGEGVVEDVYFDDFYGYTVAVNYGNGVVAYYMNLTEGIPQEVAKGANVKTGQVIGAIGESAAIESADVAHLHFSVKRDGHYVDPGEFLRG